MYRNFGSVAKDFAMVKNYVDFLNIKEENGLQKQLEKDIDIILKNVSFTYPGAKRLVINSISFTIHNG